MVKNKKGGSKHKKLARKNVKNTFVKRKLRKAVDKSEIYAQVTKVNGGGMFDVLCFNDKKTRLLVVRKKFKGRNKRDNFITLNSILLVGLRDWSIVSGNKKEKVDLLYIYSKNQYKELFELDNFDNSLITNDNSEENIGFEITTEEDYDGDISFDIKESNTEIDTIKEEASNKEDINWDDI